MKSEFGKNRTLEIIRWVALFPVSISSGILIRYIFVMLNLIALELNAYPRSFFTLLMGSCVGNFCLGAATVTIASIIAPFYKKQLTLLMAGTVVAVSVISIVLSIVAADYRGMFAGLSIIMGAVLSAYVILKKEHRTFKMNAYGG